MNLTKSNKILDILILLYDKEKSQNIFDNIKTEIHKYNKLIRNEDHNEFILSERDVVLITYADQINEPNEKPLKTLSDFLNTHLTKTISIIHILPFFPFSSDDGFSIIDYYSVDPRLGNWDNIYDIGRKFRLIFDAVINHISRESNWFQGFLNCEKPYNNFFITMEPNVDLSGVVRPRALPLLTPVNTQCGKKYVWTTFSADQIDLNYSNPDVLLEITKVLLYYASKGADILRLDAIAYLWKELNTPCIHLWQTHTIIKFWRAVLNEVKPDLMLLSETNVPHNENVSYFGQYDPSTGKTDEAQIIYQFPLAPLVLHTFLTENTTKLNSWIGELNQPGIFLNFIASHDGIGIIPAKGILTDKEIDALIERTIKHNGRVSRKNNPNGTQSIYELNITLYDWLYDPEKDNLEIGISKFIASQAIMLSLAGLPGIYFHSLFGFSNCYKCYEKTQNPRSLNRQKFSLKYLNIIMNNPRLKESRIFNRYQELLKVRRIQKAFHPLANQISIQTNEHLFSIIRVSQDNSQIIVCLINVSSKKLHCSFSLPKPYSDFSNSFMDLITNKKYEYQNNEFKLEFEPYQVMWLSATYA